MANFEEDLLEMIDLLSFTFSSDFVEKWTYKYGPRLSRLYQIRILKALSSRKPLKIKTLYKFLAVDSGFNPEVVENFLTDIEYDLYSPIIQGRLSDLFKEQL